MNGNGKKKRSKWLLYSGIVLGIVLVGAVVLFAFTRGGTKIDPYQAGQSRKGGLGEECGCDRQGRAHHQG